MSRINLNKSLAMPLVGVGLLTLFSFGCSSTAQKKTAWSMSSHRSATPHTHRSLAAADGLGRIVFGGTPAVAEPKLPANWMLAEASE